MSPDTGEAENEYPPRNKAATPPRFPHPSPCGPLRHFSISRAPAWRSFDLRNGCRHPRVPILREFPLCPRSSPHGYPEANLQLLNPGTFLVRKRLRKQTATLPCPQGGEPATLDETGCARNRVRLLAQECRRSRYPDRCLRLASTRLEVAEPSYR